MPVKLICSSHTPLMDHVPADPKIDAEVRANFEHLASRVEAYAPDLIVIFAPDHFKCVFYDMLPPFTIGVRATAIGDYDIGGGDLNVPEDLALECIRFLHQQNVDVAMSYDLKLDHGFSQKLELLGGLDDKYPIIPIHINCAGPPLPPMHRVRKLGEAVGRWAASQDLKILVLGSGGLSHDPPVPKLKNSSPEIEAMLISGHNPSMAERRKREQENFEAARALAEGRPSVSAPLNKSWDVEFMSRMGARDFDYLDEFSEAQLTEIAGCGVHEVRSWLAAYAALSASGEFTSQQVFYHDIAEWNAGMGMAVAEPNNSDKLFS